MLNGFLAKDVIASVHVERRSGQGRILVSTRPLVAGEVLFRARGLICSRVQPRHEMWQLLQKQLAALSARGLDATRALNFEDEDVWGALQSLQEYEVSSSFSLPAVTADVQGALLSLHCVRDTPSPWAKALWEAFDLRCSAEKFQQLLEIWHLNSFVHTQRRRTSVLCLAPSFMNHSCVPNVNWYFDGDAIVCRANRDIPAGEECLLCYIPDEKMHMPTERRRRYIASTGKGFTCQCNRCRHPEERCRNVRCPHCLKSGALASYIALGSTGPGDAHCPTCGEAMCGEKLAEVLAVERRIERLLRRLDKDMCDDDDDDGALSTAEASDKELGRNKALHTLQGLVEGVLAPDRHWLSFVAAGLLKDRAIREGNHEAALPLYQRRVAFVRFAYGLPSVPTPPCPGLGWELAEMAQIQSRLRRPHAEIGLLRESLEVLLPMYGPEEEEVVQIQRRLERVAGRPALRRGAAGAAATTQRPAKRRRIPEKTPPQCFGE